MISTFRLSAPTQGVARCVMPDWLVGDCSDFAFVVTLQTPRMASFSAQVAIRRRNNDLDGVCAAILANLLSNSGVNLS